MWGRIHQAWEVCVKDTFFYPNLYISCMQDVFNMSARRKSHA